ncbi:hypothetical protein GS485_11300 [Rhodococcus hoagii]|nr:hypothetical protein [Prescottella equi]
MADGSPDRGNDTTYKVTVYALADRGLVTVDRRRHAWSTSLTDNGRYYLRHGDYPDVSVENGKNAGRSEHPPAGATAARAQEHSVSVDSLLQRLAESDGKVTIDDPPLELRAAYRRAISRAITTGSLPDGFVLRHRGRDKGPLVIRLVPQSESSPKPEPVPPVPMPAEPSSEHEVVRALVHDRGLLDVSDQARPRALLIAQAIVDESSRRGYNVSLRGDRKPSFEIIVGEDGFAVSITEEWDRGEAPDPEALGKAKYDWQRIPVTVQKVRSGRLRLELGEGQAAQAWADRKRWTLVQKLPQILAAVAKGATAAVEARLRAEAERCNRIDRWYEAVPHAKQRYTAQVNRERLQDQIARATHAEAIRAYCSRLDSVAESSGGSAHADKIAEWARWARSEADRIDPICQPEELAFETPSEILPTDIAPFMPEGMSPWRPPD